MPRRRSAPLTPEQLARKKRASARRRATRMRNQWVEKVNLREVWERDGGICQICLLPVGFEDMSPDHIIPISRGGLHVTWNVQTTHKSCNVRRRARSMDRIIAERNRRLQQALLIEASTRQPALHAQSRR